MAFFKSKRLLLAIIIIIASYGFIIYKIAELPFLYQLKQLITSNFGLLILCLVGQILLLVINLSIEALKWKSLLKSIANVNFLISFKMVLAGYSSGIFTPSKLGEPIGRLIFVDKKHWTKGAALSYFGGFVQNVAILISGLLSAIIFLIDNTSETVSSVLHYGIYLVAIIMGMFLLILIKSKSIKRFILKLKWSEILLNIYDAIKSIPGKRISIIFALSFLRVLIFSLQLFLLMVVLENDFNIQKVVIMIPIYFLSISLVPSFIFSDLGVRNSIALLIFTSFYHHQIAIVLSVSLLWIINQACPSVLGSFFIYRKSDQ